jgi:uncharacterized membrane-anchored protein
MTRRHVIALVVAVLAMLAVLTPPLWIRMTGDEVTLEIRPVDPLSLFRGNYVDLRYDVDMPRDAPDVDGSVYAVFADERPGRLLRVTEDRPDLDDGEFCVRGEATYGSLSFPHLEQFFVTSERGRKLEERLSQMVAVLKVTGGCRAVLVDIELR